MMARRFSDEERAGAVRMLRELRADPRTSYGASSRVAGQLGCTPRTVRKWARQADIDERWVAASPTILLIGGHIVTDDGARLDSRQPLNGDPYSEVVRKSLATSRLWWEAAASVVLPILRGVDDDAFALIIGRRSVLDLRSDGKARRTGLGKILPGGVATTDADTDARWRFPGKDQETWAAFRSGTLPSAHAVVCTDDPWRGGLAGEIELCASALHASGLDRYPVLVMPHTATIEQNVTEYLAWVRGGRPDLPPPEVPARERSDWPTPEHYAHFVPSDAEFRVTGMVRGGIWQDPSEVDAARVLLDSRYDYTIGFWDLVDNPVLRDALLDPPPSVPAPIASVEIPAAAFGRGGQAASRKRADAARLRNAQIQSRVLEDVGWQRWTGEPFLSYEEGCWVLPFPRAGKVSGLPSGDLPSALCLVYDIIKRQARVVPHVPPIGWYTDLGLPDYLQEHREQLEAISDGLLDDPMQRWSPIWKGTGGWADDIAWEERAQAIADMTPHWIGLLAEFAERSRRATRKIPRWVAPPSERQP